MMRDEIDCVDRRVQNGLGYFGSGVRRERPTKTNLGMDGKTRTAVVFDSVKDGKSVEDHPHGADARGDCRY